LRAALSKVMLPRPFQSEAAMGRTIAGVVVGVVVAWLAIMLAEFASAPLHPTPAGFDMDDPASVAAFVATLPVAALLLVLAGWVLGALIGGYVAARIARRLRPALTVGIVIVVGVIANAVMIPHPLWMTIAGALLPVPAAWIGARLATRRASDGR
jgi:MFS family permease